MKRVKLLESSGISGIIRYLLPPYPPAGPKMEPRGDTGPFILRLGGPFFGIKCSHRFSDAFFPDFSGFGIVLASLLGVLGRPNRSKRPQDRPKRLEEGLKTGQNDNFYSKN